jgi:hypothetical protein
MEYRDESVITISNIRKNSKGEYVGRANKTFGVKESSLANSFPLNKEREREYVIEMYKHWLESVLTVDGEDNPVRIELNRLRNIYLETGELNLVCWCHPKRCHAEIIREFLLEEIKNGQVETKMER